MKLKKYYKPILIDVLTFIIIAGLWLSFGSILNERAVALNQGKSLDQLKFDIISNPEAAQAMVSTLKVLIGLLTLGTIIIVVLTFIIYSYSRSKLWNSKYTKKWNLMTVVTLLSLTVILSIFGLIKVLFTAANPIISKFILAVLFLIFLMWTFLNHHYLTKHKLAEAISKTMKTSLKKASLVLISGLAIWVIISLLASLLRKQFYWTLLTWPGWLLTGIQLAVVLVIIAWFRELTVKKLTNS